jgi:hypothetical protein
MKHLRNIVVLCVVFGLSSIAAADMFRPSHYCSKPYKPFEFDSQREVDNFNDDVEDYSRCINDFVEEQTEEAQKHQRAAEDAIDEWNSFVRIELN